MAHALDRLGFYTLAGAPRSPRDLLDMEFGLGCYSDEELWEIYTVFRKLRVNYGDFRAES